MLVLYVYVCMIFVSMEWVWHVVHVYICWYVFVGHVKMVMHVMPGLVYVMCVCERDM